MGNKGPRTTTGKAKKIIFGEDADARKNSNRLLHEEMEKSGQYAYKKVLK
jgi:hypothetical protein